MADPLTLLRQYNVNKKHITEQNDQIIFGEYSWPKSVKTNYIVWNSGKDDNPKDYYTLECLLFLLKNVDLPHPQYVRKAAVESIPIIRRPDRKKLLAYLNGETATSPSIDISAPHEISTTVKRVHEEQQQQDVFKKPRWEEVEVQRAKDQLAARSNAPKEASVTTQHISVANKISSKADMVSYLPTTLDLDLAVKDEEDVLKAYLPHVKKHFPSSDHRVKDKGLGMNKCFQSSDYLVKDICSPSTSKRSASLLEKHEDLASSNVITYESVGPGPTENYFGWLQKYLEMKKFSSPFEYEGME